VDSSHALRVLFFCKRLFVSPSFCFSPKSRVGILKHFKYTAKKTMQRWHEEELRNRKREKADWEYKASESYQSQMVRQQAQTDWNTALAAIRRIFLSQIENLVDARPEMTRDYIFLCQVQTEGKRPFFGGIKDTLPVLSMEKLWAKICGLDKEETMDCLSCCQEETMDFLSCCNGTLIYKAYLPVDSDTVWTQIEHLAPAVCNGQAPARASMAHRCLGALGDKSYALVLCCVEKRDKRTYSIALESTQKFAWYRQLWRPFACCSGAWERCSHKC
jgi:hypothetical protein